MDNSLQAVNLRAQRRNGATAQRRNGATAQRRNGATAQRRNGAISGGNLLSQSVGRCCRAAARLTGRSAPPFPALHPFCRGVHLPRHGAHPFSRETMPQRGGAHPAPLELYLQPFGMHPLAGELHPASPGQHPFSFGMHPMRQKLRPTALGKRLFPFGAHPKSGKTSLFPQISPISPVFSPIGGNLRHRRTTSRSTPSRSVKNDEINQNTNTPLP